jgi:hypothetical protein
MLQHGSFTPFACRAALFQCADSAGGTLSFLKQGIAANALEGKAQRSAF